MCFRHALFSKCYSTACVCNNYKYLTQFACFCMISNHFKKNFASKRKFLTISCKYTRFLNFDVWLGSQTYACISPVNYTMICLPSNLVNDGIVHCLGALDEQTVCRSANPLRDTFYYFRCTKGLRCLSISQMCNEQKDCSEGDDENENLPRSKDTARIRPRIRTLYLAQKYGP
jgi:hypothetical protein